MPEREAWPVGRLEDRGGEAVCPRCRRGRLRARREVLEVYEAPVLVSGTVGPFARVEDRALDVYVRCPVCGARFSPNFHGDIPKGGRLDLIAPETRG